MRKLKVSCQWHIAIYYKIVLCILEINKTVEKFYVTEYHFHQMWQELICSTYCTNEIEAHCGINVLMVFEILKITLLNIK